VIQLLEGDRQRAEASTPVKVADAAKHVSGKVDLEVMALSKGSVREVSLKDGSVVKKGEVVLGDDTGEITFIAWDAASKIVGEIRVGEKLRVRGAVVQVSKMGVETLELRDSTKIERL
jgi:DNA/RNA endonuclease YhcR with UshA esterase domain